MKEQLANFLPVFYQFVERNSWFILLAAGVFEVAWALSLKLSHGYTKLTPTLATIPLALASTALAGHVDARHPHVCGLYGVGWSWRHGHGDYRHDVFWRAGHPWPPIVHCADCSGCGGAEVYRGPRDGQLAVIRAFSPAGLNISISSKN
jgi:hypothetical protein